MTKQNTITLEHFPTEQLRVPATSSSELSLADLLLILLQHKKLICGAGVLGALAAKVVLLLLPPSYMAEATILPPQQTQSSLAMLATGAVGGLAGGMTSQLGIKNSADIYIGILKSRTIADELVRQFHLQSVYGTKLMSGTRKALGAHANFSSSRESLITISIKDSDAKRAAALANAFVDQLHKQNSRLALTDASQRRLFFEQQLHEERDALANAEIALKETQQSTGLLVPSGQAEVLIRSGAQLRAEIVSREVQLQAMRSYETDENPQVQVVKREIEALQAQANQIGAGGASGLKMDISGGRLPAASLEYVRKLRDVKYHETLYELLAKQYEVARIDEAKQAPLIQVVDRAVVPDRDSRTQTPLILTSGVLGIILGMLYLAISSATIRLFAQLKQRSRVQEVAFQS